MIRGSPKLGSVRVMTPKLPPLRFVFGMSKFTWLKTLKNSARNCTFMSVPMRKFLNSPMSQVCRFGP